MVDTAELVLVPLRTPHKDPEIIISFNGDARQMMLREEMRLPVELVLGRNVLRITLMNKSGNDTVMRDGRTVEDLAVIIKSLTYRNQDLTDLMHRRARYVLDDGSELPNIHGYMGFNGTWELSMEGPLFIWARDMDILDPKK